jgi:hypothetical protein
MNVIPEPGQYDGGRFAKSGRVVDQLRTAVCPTGQPLSFGTAIAFATCKATLVVVRRRFFCGGSEKVVESNQCKISGH